MTVVTVRAALPLTWLGHGQEVTVARTRFIDGLIRSGSLQVVEELAPVVPAPVEVAKPAKAARKRSGR